MAGQRRYARSQQDDAEQLNAWRMTFEGGFDFLSALPRIGVAIDDKHRPPSDTAREAWRRLGSAFLASRADQPGEPWALAAFGSPGEGKGDLPSAPSGKPFSRPRSFRS